MSKIFTLPIVIIFSLLIQNIFPKSKVLSENAYEKNLNSASVYYLQKKKIPESILLKLVPENQIEFNIYYGTTESGHKLAETNFFYDTTRIIFEQVTSNKNNNFYLPSLKLISFADGEFAEGFIQHLEIIIKMDEEKFCKSISGKEYAKYNPIKYYSELIKCE